MKKTINYITETIKKHDNIFVFFYYIFSLILYIYLVKLDVSDELWLFSFLHRFVNNYDLYKDLNVIITPMFYYIGKIIFLIFGNNYISFRIYNILIFSSLFLTMYVVLKKLKVSKIFSFFAVLSLSFFMIPFIMVGANYNVLVIVFVLIGISLELDEKRSLKQNIIKGIILFCIFMTKQNVFVYYSIALVIHYLFKIKFKKIKIKDIITIFGVFVILFALFLLYLQINNSLNDFISNCFLGIGEFSQSNFLIYREASIAIIDIIGIMSSIVIINIKKINKEIRKKNLEMLPFSICMLFISYPIFNLYHIFFGSIVVILILIYNCNYLLCKKITSFHIFTNILRLYIVIITIGSIYLNIYYLNLYSKLEESKNNTYPYNNIIIADNVKQNINDVCEYIKENEEQNIDIKIISYEAFLYMNILNRTNKYFDLPLLGNLGKDGESMLISKVENLEKGTKILISKDPFVQESNKLINKIKKEYKYIGEIATFYIYQK